ncbi:hypothetical protein M5X11_00240 [Paenibacillus alginolyticus]|uniref:SDR family oxidoreductase n=1 Tax=Paenibacillus alginolyticus TaxID=59839 RepID=A0ABT4GMA8_9BACL|nr:hypothetical protein [Paenibacillus alginolyticus]MCY9663430.1 hypothetical protein [Paenibacillus alginolyticus]MCY9697343.1 hypothetical protein [Paenibacillus alginolyticus]MEC0148206.1 hypothetical protein [Paenibacillus alginolyticus]
MGIRVNVVTPGSIRTPLWESPGGFAESLASKLKMDREEAIVYYTRNIRKMPIERLGNPEEVASYGKWRILKRNLTIVTILIRFKHHNLG